MLLFISLVEVRSDLIEQAIGAYLKVHNKERPKLGRLAEQEARNLDAYQKVMTLADELEEHRRLAEQAVDLNDLRPMLEEGPGVILSKNKFVEIYDRLPREYSTRLIDPFQLLALYHDTAWSRTLLSKDETGLRVLLVDDGNRVIREILVTADLFDLIQSYDADSEVTLDDFAKYRGRVYSAQAFYQVFNRFPKALRLQLVGDPYVLLKWGDRLQRVGIADVVVDGTVEMAFEVNQGGRIEIIPFSASQIIVSFLIQELDRALATESEGKRR